MREGAPPLSLTSPLAPTPGQDSASWYKPLPPRPGVGRHTKYALPGAVLNAPDNAEFFSLNVLIFTPPDMERGMAAQKTEN